MLQLLPWMIFIAKTRISLWLCSTRNLFNRDLWNWDFLPAVWSTAHMPYIMRDQTHIGRHLPHIDHHDDNIIKNIVTQIDIILYIWCTSCTMRSMCYCKHLHVMYPYTTVYKPQENHLKMEILTGPDEKLSIIKSNWNVAGLFIAQGWTGIEIGKHKARWA